MDYTWGNQKRSFHSTFCILLLASSRWFIHDMIYFMQYMYILTHTSNAASMLPNNVIFHTFTLCDTLQGREREQGTLCWIFLALYECKIRRWRVLYMSCSGCGVIEYHRLKWNWSDLCILICYWNEISIYLNCYYHIDSMSERYKGEVNRKEHRMGCCPQYLQSL